MALRTTRRSLVRATGAGLAALSAHAVAGPSVLRLPRREKLNVASIGVGGRGGGNTQGISGENLVAICDVDLQRAAGARNKFPHARFFTDYRELLDEFGDRLDALAVSTPDHMHAPIAIAAMERGIHCYCEKPLTWSIEEAREMARLAREKSLVTQMGNQGTSAGGFRAGVEALRAGVIGPVREVHVWTNRPVWPQAVETPVEEVPVPNHLSWDLWLGCAAEREYHPSYLPFKWRGWYDFGTGALGDMACHTVNLPYMGLELGAPTSAVAETTELFADSYPAGAKVVFEFPERGEKPAVTLNWYEGKVRPSAELMPGRDLPGSGCLIIGEAGRMFSADDYGSRQEIVLDDGSEPVTPEHSLPRSPGHHAEWIAAIRGEGPAPMSNFLHAGPFTEAVLVGDLAMRIGGRIEWDATEMRAKDRPEAGALIRRGYRDGFGIS